MVKQRPFPTQTSRKNIKHPTIDVSFVGVRFPSITPCCLVVVFSDLTNEHLREAAAAAAAKQSPAPTIPILIARCGVYRATYYHKASFPRADHIYLTLLESNFVCILNP